MNKTAASARFGRLCVSASLASSMALTAHADDIDVYTAQIAARQKPNILFVLDYSGSMKDNIEGGTASNANPAKIDILKGAMETVLDDNLDRINAGIGSLYSTTTTGIRWPVSELNADASSVDPAIPAGKFTVRDIIGQQINERSAGGWTATVDALVEAAQYFRGEAVTHNDSSQTDSARHQPPVWNEADGRYSGGNSQAAIAASYSPSNAYAEEHELSYFCNDYSASGGPNFCENRLVSDCKVLDRDDRQGDGYENLENLWGNYQRCQYKRGIDWVGARYNSPITQTCQANTIVLISDGEPTRINDGASLRNLIGKGVGDCVDLSTGIFNKAAGERIDGNCGPEVLRSLSATDQNPDIPGSRVNTYTVGFSIDGPGQDYLTLLADAGNGSYFKADKPEELTAALSTIVDEVLGGSENFTQLSIDVDKANFSHDNRAFFNLFSPSVRRAWNGNLKGYFVNGDGLADINGMKATIATDQGEQFAEETQSFWSDSNDGNNVSEGGASEQLLSGTRNLYTYTGDAIPPNGAALAGVANNRLVSANDKISFAMMNLPEGSARRDSSLDWIQNAPMGDPLHSKSVSLDYGARQIVYVMTNQGLLHAIDASKPVDPANGDSSGGQELFAFMPGRLLPNLPMLEENRNTGSHIYGLDGQITRWHTDINNDGIVNNNEKVLLILGMRRGGEAYFALDVSNPDSPRLEWILDSSNPDFPALAQSWSRMSLINVRDGAASRRVLAFGAGYDAAVLDSATGPVTSRGNGIYMVDEDGKLLWKVDSADHASMRYAIASDLTVIDSDGDSLADRLYVGDVGGQLWRVDFEDINTRPDVTLLADLADKHHQPFFYPPSVAFNRSSSGDYLSVSLGSGNRTNPLQTGVQNHLFMIRDRNLDKGAPEDGFTTVLAKELFDATSDSISSDDADEARKAQKQLDTAPGWKVALAPDEKALSGLVTFEGKLLGTTFQADAQTEPGACGFDTTGRFYMMDVENAAATDMLGSNLSEADEGGHLTRVLKLRSSGIPSSPVIIFPKGSGNVQVYVDKEAVSLMSQKLARVYWHAR